jgi:hypothetical protein
MMRRRLSAAILAFLALCSAANAAYMGTPPLLVPDGGTGAATFTQYGVILGNGTGALGVTAQGTSGIPLIGQGAANPIFGTAIVAGGGTGLATLTAHAILLGEGTGNVAFAVGAADSVPLWQSSSADPTITAINNCATALTYATSTHTFGCNASVGVVPTLTIYTTSNATVALGSTNLETVAFNQAGTKATVIDLPASPASSLRKCVKDGGNNFATTSPTIKTTDSTTIDAVAGTTGISMNQAKSETCFLYDGASNWNVE